MVLIPDTYSRKKLLQVGIEAIAIRSVRFVLLKELAKEMGLTEWYLGKAHNFALVQLMQSQSRVMVNGDGTKKIKYEVMKNYIAEVEPEWMNEKSKEELFGIYADVEPEWLSRRVNYEPTTDEKAYFYMRNKF